jgi:isopenicillin-N epimerase
LRLPLDLPAIDADFYTGNCHKWLCSPKGSGFLYARRDVQPLLEPLVVSWGWDNLAPSGSEFIDHYQWLGTIDPAAYLATPAAIQFQADHNWLEVRAACHELLTQALQRIADLTGCAPAYPLDDGYYAQMAIAPIPYQEDPAALKKRLYDEFNVEVVCHNWQSWTLLRISIQGYNSQSDVDALLTALEQVL